MSILTGDEYTIREVQELAATVTDNFYFPPGIRIASLTNDTGLHQRIILKEWCISASASGGDIRLLGVRINYRDGSVEDLFGDGGGDALYAQAATYPNAGQQCMIDINDIANIEMVVRNANGAAAKYFTAHIRYEGIAPGAAVTKCH